MRSKLSPLIPIIVMCCQQPLVVVRLPDGRVGATLQSLCAAINLSRASQLLRIRRNWALAQHLVLVPLMTKSGLQHMDVLLAGGISFWLAGIQVDRLTPEKRAVARALREMEEQDILEKDILQHFAEAEAHQPSRPAPEEPSAGQGILSPRHIIQLVVLARALRAQTGEPIPAMYAELAEVFAVEDFSDIPDAGWDVVQEWFLQRAREA